MATIGLLARAFVYALIGMLSLKAALLPGNYDKGFSPQDAFFTLETSIWGRMLLLTIAAGLALYAIWRWLQAFADTADEGETPTGLLARAGMIMSGNSYALVGIAAGLTTLGQNRDDGGGGTTKTAVSWLLEQPFGMIVTALAGLTLIAIGIAQMWRVKTDEWRSSIHIEDAPSYAPHIIQFAIFGRGVLFVLVGMFISFAGWTGQSSDSKGLAETLSWLRKQPFGIWLYITSALILLAYGFYSYTQARHTKLN